MIKKFKFNFFYIVALIFILYGLGLLIFVGWHFGNLMVLLLGCMLAVFGFIKEKNIRNKYTAALKILAATGLLCLAAIISFIYLFYLQAPLSEKNEDAVIVLGCGLDGEEVSASLKERLDACLLYIKENPDAIIIVSGGQGPSEDITEAAAMERYLIENNVSDNRIIKEDKSSSTYENFVNSKKILDELYAGRKDEYTTAFITNRFHCYRAYNLAKNAGIEVSCFPAPDEINSAVPSYLREAFAVIKLWVLGI